MPEVNQHRALICEECGLESEGSARDWRALLTVDKQVALYCSQCAEREFGESST